MHHPGRFFTMANACETGEDVSEIILSDIHVRTTIVSQWTYYATGGTIVWDWGDGTVETFSGSEMISDASHTYAKAGSYVIRITGPITRITGNDALKIPWLGVEGEIGNSYIRSVWLAKSVLSVGTHAFHRCGNLFEFHGPGVGYVGVNAFYQAYAMREFDAPNVYEIQSNAIYGSTNIRRFRMKAWSSHEIPSIYVRADALSQTLAQGEFISNADTCNFDTNAFRGASFVTMRLNNAKHLYIAENAFNGHAIDLYIESMSQNSIQMSQNYSTWGLLSGYAKIHCSGGIVYKYPYGT